MTNIIRRVFVGSHVHGHYYHVTQHGWGGGHSLITFTGQNRIGYSRNFTKVILAVTGSLHAAIGLYRGSGKIFSKKVVWSSHIVLYSCITYVESSVRCHDIC